MKSIFQLFVCIWIPRTSWFYLINCSWYNAIQQTFPSFYVHLENNLQYNPRCLLLGFDLWICLWKHMMVEEKKSKRWGASWVLQSKEIRCRWLLPINRRQTDLQREGRMKGKFTVFSGSNQSQKVSRPFTRICLKKKMKRHLWLIVSKCMISFEGFKIFLSNGNWGLRNFSCMFLKSKLIIWEKKNKIKCNKRPSIIFSSCVRWKFWVHKTCHILSGISTEKQQRTPKAFFLYLFPFSHFYFFFFNLNLAAIFGDGVKLKLFPKKLEGTVSIIKYGYMVSRVQIQLHLIIFKVFFQPTRFYEFCTCSLGNYWLCSWIVWLDPADSSKKAPGQAWALSHLSPCTG